MAVRPGTLDILSICTGGGGLDLGVGLAIPGARSVCMVEREAFAVAHLVSAMRAGLLHPAPVWSDAGTFDGRRWRGCVDGLIGGIPCQPHSLAGRKRGSLDERDLWSVARRIVVQSRCWFVLIENVAGMLSAGADEIAGAERVWRDLQKLGFAVEVGLFTAAEVGGATLRTRVFVLAVSDDARCQRAERPREQDQAVQERQTPRREPLRPTGGFGPPRPDQVALIPRDPDAAAGRLHRHRADGLRMLGNAVVPLQAAYALRTLVARLAARGSPGADRLLRMMGDDE